MERGRTRPGSHGVPSPVGALTHTAPNLRQASRKTAVEVGLVNLTFLGKERGRVS